MNTKEENKVKKENNVKEKNNNVKEEDNKVIIEDNIKVEEKLIFELFQIEEALKLNEIILKERDEEFKQIHKKAHIINDVMQDLKNIIEIQGDSINLIQDNTLSVLNHTNNAVEQIKIADKNQKNVCLIS